MASRPDPSRTALIFIAATAASAALWWFGSGLNPLWWLTWLAPLPVLLASTHMRGRWAALAAFLAFAIGGGNEWVYLHELIALPLAIVLLAIAGPGLCFALCTTLFRRLLLQGRVALAALAVPSLWVALEYISSLLSPHGTFGNIGYSQMDALPVIQIAAVTGIWGIGFLVLLVPATIAALATPSASLRERLIAITIAVLLPTAALGYGVWRLQVPALSTMRVGLASIEKPIRPNLHDAAGQALQARYVDAINRLAAAGAQTIVIPETSFATSDSTIPAFAKVATRKNVLLDIGIDYKGDARAERNMAMVFVPGAAMPATYSKHHLIPGFESRYTPGEDDTLLAGATRIGLAICKDMDFHDTGRAYGARDAQLLLVPAWDFGADGWLHSRMAILRGVESGIAVARAARTGRLTLSDDRGRVVAEASSEEHDAALVGAIPLRETHTLYTRWGDWFAWIVLASSLICIMLALRRGEDFQRRH